jgi:hypothetical protein
MIWTEPVKVVGTRYYLQGVDIDVLGDIVKLDRESDNSFHGQAIAVWGLNIASGEQIKLGYVLKELADMVKNEQLPTTGRITWKKAQPKLVIRIQA